MKTKTQQRIEDDPRIEDLYQESENGWFAVLKPGFISELTEVHELIENTLTELDHHRRSIVECDCAGCVALLEERQLARFKAICDKITVEVTDVVAGDLSEFIQASVDARGDYIFLEIDPEDCERALINITRLWNWADHQPDGVPYWDILKDRFPTAFRDPSKTNSVRFTYN